MIIEDYSIFRTLMIADLTFLKLNVENFAIISKSPHYKTALLTLIFKK